MKKSSNKKLYDFLIDKTNKNLIVSLLALAVFILCTKFINNLFLRLAIYFFLYFLINNLYLKVVRLFFDDICRYKL